MTRLLLVDFHDSYTYNVRDLVHAATGVLPTVILADDPALDASLLASYDGLILSPGPGTPTETTDVGSLPRLVEGYAGPVLGVCLGHQILATLLGATVERIEPCHGTVSSLRHTGEGLFLELPQDLEVVRYHSLAVTSWPARLVPDAWADDVLMAFHATDRPWWGVQFHPESVLSQHGVAMVRSWAREGGLLPDAPCVREIPVPEVAHAHDIVAASHPFSFWLDSSAVVEGLSRWSFLGTTASPSLVAWADRVDIVAPDGGVLATEPSGALASLRRHMTTAHPSEPTASEPPIPLTSGWVGYLGYEARRELGVPVAHTPATPEAVWMRTDRMVAIDHAEGRAFLVAAAVPDIDAARAWLDATQAALLKPPRRRPPLPADIVDAVRALPGRRRDNDADYEAKVRQAQEHLRAGESYEVCLTTTASADVDATPAQLREAYLRQRAANPAPYSAFLTAPGVTVLSSSPERFLAVRSGGVETKPIKGTLPRGADPVEDEALRRRLAADPKSRAELLMVVDLLRNDLSRVCEPASVVTPDLMVVESYQTVHQLLSRITGRLRDDVDVLDVLAATFPGGSMTGAPKERTMQIIDALEDGPRGVYSGTLGWIGADGSADLSIVIRTLVHDGRTLSIGAGGAVVLDSDPAAERDEMLLKMAAPLRWVADARSDELPHR